jgi:hypothetical protein
VNPLFANVVPAQPENIDVSVFSQHSGYVNSLAYHPEGSLVFTRFVLMRQDM